LKRLRHIPDVHISPSIILYSKCTSNNLKVKGLIPN